jgi:hypothetical protein
MEQWLEKRWQWGIFAAWLALAIIMILARLPAIEALALGDTDDNLRLAQIRALMAGQNWYDLTQYRLAPPFGADIHWSHLPDLPIVGLALALEPFLGGEAAERWSAALAPLIPLGIAFTAVALIARRLISPSAWPLALVVTLCAGVLMPMWLPLRIDHHGWQLALLALAVAGLSDPQRGRGGVTTGLATALSFAIGLEMLAFLALIGGATTLFWIRFDQERRRLAGYGAALGGGAALGFALFASTANRGPVCDALSPVWLSALVGAGALLVLLATLNFTTWRGRLAAAAIAGSALAIGFALLWPDCLTRPEGVSAELQALWLDNVSEARPLQRQSWRQALIIAALPVSGLIGSLIAFYRNRHDDRLMPLWMAITTLAFAGFSLLFWQVRIAPAAQLLALPGATALGLLLLSRWRATEQMLLRVAGTIAALALASGLVVTVPIALAPKAEDPAKAAATSQASRCATSAALQPISTLPKGVILTTIDFAPRLLVMTDHSAIAGPYHRNGGAILDVMNAFRGDGSELRATIDQYGVTHVLVCPGMSGEWLYGANDPDSVFARLLNDQAPAGLRPVPLPENSPFRLWRTD